MNPDDLRRVETAPVDFKKIFEAAPGLFLVLLPNDPTYTIAAVSNAYAEGTFTRREEILGRGVFEVFPENPNDPTATGVSNLTASLRRVIATKAADALAVQKYDIRLPGSRRHEFEERYWSAVNSPVLNEDGTVQYIVHRVEDITDLLQLKSIEAEQGKVAEAQREIVRKELVWSSRELTRIKQLTVELRQQWRTFDTALSHTPDFTYVFDLEGRFTYANRSLLSLWQKSLGEAVGKNFFELEYPPELAARLQRQIQQVIDTKDVLRDLTPFTGPTGETREYEYIFVPIFATDGSVEAVAGSTRDITERRRIEAALAASERRLQQVFEQAPVAIAVFRGQDFIVELANPTYQALLPGRDLVGRRLADAVPEIGRPVWDVLKSVFRNGERFVANEWHITYDADQDGIAEDHWFNVAYDPLRESDGSVVGVIAVLTDVTVQMTGRKELERANRELEEFAYVASHDIQEPLRMVNVYTQLLLRQFSGEDAKAQQYAGFVRQGTRHMEQLIQDLLSYSSSVQKPESPVRSADLSAALAEAMDVLKTGIEESGAVITADPLPRVYGDTRQLAHVFQNVLSNALKYRRRDVPLSIHITAKFDGANCVVSVCDNGIGFEPQYAERIFGLFKRLHREEYPGTGLGLAICHRIIERYGGRIWAQGTPGRGACIFFSLRCVQGDNQGLE